MKKIFHIIKSVFGAFIGIQSERIHEIDSKENSLWLHVIVAIIFAIIFVLILLSFVNWVVLVDQ